jgi:hypothetical protein
MERNVFTKSYLMIYAPDRYFREVISLQEFTIKNLAIYGTLIFAAITILLVAPLPYTGLHSVVYAFGFFIGLVPTLFLRSYFIDVSLRKMEIQIPFKQIASVVLFSFIIYIYAILTGILFGYDLLVFARICNYILILIGIHSLTKINIYPLFGIGLLLYLLEFALVAVLSSLLL